MYPTAGRPIAIPANNNIVAASNPSGQERSAIKVNMVEDEARVCSDDSIHINQWQSWSHPSRYFRRLFRSLRRIWPDFFGRWGAGGSDLFSSMPSPK